MTRWIIFYADGTTFSDEDGDPIDAPSAGVIAVKQRKKDGIENLQSRGDYYWYDAVDDWWYDGNIIGIVERLTMMNRRGKILVFLGRYIPTDSYERIKREAQDHRFKPR